MIMIVKALLFVCGLCICVQVIAALYGIIDLWYTIRTAYVGVMRRILFWGIITGGMAWLLGNELRGAFLWGYAVYGVIYVVGFWGHQLLFKRNSRLLGLSGKFLTFLLIIH